MKSVVQPREAEALVLTNKNKWLKGKISLVETQLFFNPWDGKPLWYVVYILKRKNNKPEKLSVCVDANKPEIKGVRGGWDKRDLKFGGIIV